MLTRAVAYMYKDDDVDKAVSDAHAECNSKVKIIRVNANHYKFGDDQKTYVARNLTTVSASTRSIVD